jgi:AcrR family transcriptional regulator
MVYLTQVERSTTTRAKILAVARAAFVRDGYDGASLERIATEAELTKGALYHHYSGKEALLAAVFSLVSQEIMNLLQMGSIKLASPREQLKASTMAWLKAVESSDARAIILDIGPKALGFARARAFEDTITLEPLLNLVRAVIDAERLEGTIDAPLIARLINAALSEIALLRHASDMQTPTADAARKAIAGIIDGLLIRA